MHAHYKLANKVDFKINFSKGDNICKSIFSTLKLY